ncbi:MAG: ABC transporter permease [Agriterribacter sp.]
MLKNYFKIAWRNIAKGGMYSIINISGLAIALASFILVLLYLNYELSYDKWDPSLEKVYKISLQSEGNIMETTPEPLSLFLKNKLPNVVSSVKLQNSGDFEALLSTKNKQIFQKNIVSADSLFLEVFPYHLIQGNPATALKQPFTAILSYDLALKLFGKENPIGKTIKVYNFYDVTVSGVFEKPSGPSSLDAEMVYRYGVDNGDYNWENYSFETYVKLQSATTIPLLESAINEAFYRERIQKDNQSFADYLKNGAPTRLFADQLAQLHNFPSHGESNFKTVAILLILAALLLIAGAINFSNLSIAASIRRAKEVGVRKVLGSGRINIAWQFLMETALQVIVCFCLALSMVLIILPFFKQALNIYYNISAATNMPMLAWQIGGCLFIVIVLSGIYPSLFLSRFSTAKVLKGDYSHGTKGSVLRNSLIVVQFVLSGFFIITTLGINSQMRYMASKDKGFSGQQVMRLQVSQKTGEQGFQTLREELLSIKGVSYVSKTTNVPGDGYLDTTTSGYKIDGKLVKLGTVKVSTDYFKTLEIPLLKGRLFDERLTDQDTRSVILNESAAKATGLSDPVGKTIYFPYCDSIPVQIIGVVKDFNTRDFATAITPKAYSINNKTCGYMWGGAVLVKLGSADLRPVIAGIENVWKKAEPDVPIRYSFLDDNFQQLLSSYVRTQNIIMFFTVIAIAISLMGLFALTAFLTGSRHKEISIRKIAGAGVGDIVGLLSKGFLKMVLLGTVIALPLAGIALHKWLQTFVYRTDIGWPIYLVAIIVVVAAAAMVISIQTVRAAIANPVKSLRAE